MTTQINPAGTDWLLIRAHLNTRIAELHREMESPLAPEMYNQHRGAILLARELIEKVEPTSPPKTTEDNYGMSDPEEEKYT